MRSESRKEGPWPAFRQRDAKCRGDLRGDCTRGPRPARPAAWPGPEVNAAERWASYRRDREAAATASEAQGAARPKAGTTADDLKKVRTDAELSENRRRLRTARQRESPHTGRRRRCGSGLAATSAEKCDRESRPARAGLQCLPGTTAVQLQLGAERAMRGVPLERHRRSTQRGSGAVKQKTSLASTTPSAPATNATMPL